MTPLAAGHPFQMADDAETEVPSDWMAVSSWHSTRTSARMPSDTATGTGCKDNLEIQPGSKELGRWAVRAPTNTRAIGNLEMVELKKGPSGGLGFSITMRDNLEGPNSPIYIKHILPDGAAIKDGRLRPGDRLLQVNDEMMTGKCLSDVTAILRTIEIDALTRIVVSRQMAAQTETKASPQIRIDKSDSPEDVGSKEDALVSLHSASESSSSKEDALVRLHSASESCSSKEDALVRLHSASESCSSKEDALVRLHSASESCSSKEDALVRLHSASESCSSKEDALVRLHSASESSLSKEDALVDFHSASESSSSISFSWIKCDDRLETVWLRVTHDRLADSDQLGLRVKRSTRHNLSGLRIRSVIRGGMADKDGQLQANDHLIQVNGISLADVDRSTAVNIFRSVLRRSVEQLSAIDITIIRWKAPEAFPPPSKLELMVCDESSECRALDTALEEADCEKRIIPFSNAIRGSGVVEGFSVDCLALVNHDVVFSSGKHSSDFFPDGNVLSTVKGQSPDLCENDVCIDSIKGRVPDDNSASAVSSLEPCDVVVQDKEEVDLKVVCFERQGFGRKSISEKRSSRELLSDSEVYRSIKENRKRKDQTKPEMNAGSHEATDFDRGALEQFKGFEPSTLGSDLQDPDLSNQRGPLPNASATLGSVSDKSCALGLHPQGSLPNQSSAQPVHCSPLESVWLGNAPMRYILHGSSSIESNSQAENECSSIKSISQNPFGSVPCRSVPPGYVPPGSVPPGSVPPVSVPPGSVPPGSVPPGYVPSGSVSPGSVPSGYALQGSIQHGSVSLESDPNAPVLPGPHDSLPQKSVPSAPHGFVSHRSVPREYLPHDFIPPGSFPQESVPLGAKPDVLMNACISSDLHLKRFTEVPTTAVVIRQSESVVHSSSTSSQQIPSETFPIASSPSSSAKPSKKFTASLIRRFFKKGFSDLFGSETQTGSNRQSDKVKNEDIVKHFPPKNSLIRKDFSLPRSQSNRIESDVISSSHSHPDLQQSYPNALRTVPPNFYNPQQFLHHPTGFQVPLSSPRNSFPVQFYRPNPYPFSTILVRSHVPAVPTGFALCPTYVPRELAPAPVFPIHGDRFLSPSACQARLSWVEFRQKFVNVQRFASQEPRVTNQ